MRDHANALGMVSDRSEIERGNNALLQSRVADFHLFAFGKSVGTAWVQSCAKHIGVHRVSGVQMQFTKIRIAVRIC